MKFLGYTILTLFILTIVSCSNREGEIIELLNAIKSQNESLKTQIAAVKKTADSALVATNTVNSTLALTNKNITSIQADLKSVLSQIASLTTQMTQANADLVLIKSKIDALQVKCSELISQINNLTSNGLGTTLKNGLIEYYTFAGNANDIFGNAGIFSGSSYTTGFSNLTNNALQLNNSEYVKTAKVIDNVYNNFTISAWVNPNGNLPVKSQSKLAQGGERGQPVIHPAHGSNWGDMSLNAGVGLYFGNNQIQVVEHTHLFIGFPLVYSGNFTGWNLAVVVYENHIPRLYLNGELVAIGVATNINFVRPSNGNDYTTMANYSSSGFGSTFSPGATEAARFSGKIDDIGIWNRVLTPEEIKYLYQNTFNPK